MPRSLCEALLCVSLLCLIVNGLLVLADYACGDPVHWIRLFSVTAGYATYKAVRRLLYALVEHAAQQEPGQP